MISIYTDGAYSFKRNQGGWAFVVIEDGIKIYSTFGSQLNTTNNRMEVYAAIRGCLWLKAHNYTEATIYSDSMYLVGTMAANWKQKTNLDLWQQLTIITKDLTLTWVHIDGHSGDKYNELCDILAVAGSHCLNN
jgi:ribonuclease HI